MSEPMGKIGFAGFGERLHLSLVAFFALTSEIQRPCMFMILMVVMFFYPCDVSARLCVT
jgi:hypothetical protein